MPSTLNDSTPMSAVYSQIGGYIRVFDQQSTTDGQDDIYPVSAYQSTFMLNAIPVAQVVIPVGKSANNDVKETVLRARELADKLKQFRNATVWLKPEGEFAPGKTWPSEVRVFNGYVTGTALTRSATMIGVTVQLTHWIMDLDASSSLSSELAKGTPVGLELPIVDSDYKATVSVPKDAALDNVASDFWNKGLKEKFKQLTQKGTISAAVECAAQAIQSTLTTNVVGGLQNDLALRRLDGTAVGTFDDKAFIDVPECRFIETLQPALQGAMVTNLTNVLFNGTAGNSSMLDILLKAISLFQLSLVVTVDSATIAPMSPCPTGDEVPRQVTIKANEYFTFSPSEPTFRVWRGVSLHGQYTSQTGSMRPEYENNQSGIPSSNGCYVAEVDESLPEEFRARAKNGVFQFIPAPQWIMDESTADAFRLPETMPNRSVKINNTMEGESAATNEDEVPALANTTTPVATAHNPELNKRIGDSYAKWWYWVNQFISRTGELTGKLRFDIAPGSIIRIEDIDGKLYESAEEFGYLYALVTSVRISVDAINGAATTSFTLSHIRREGEKAYGVPKHPLYQQAWVGTVLQNIKFTDTADKKAKQLAFVPEVGSHELA